MTNDGRSGGEARPEGHLRRPDSPGPPPSHRATGLVLYVHQRPDGVRALTGGGVTADGICADIFDTVPPGGVWNGLRFEDLAPGRYDIVDGRLVREDGSIVPSDADGR